MPVTNGSNGNNSTMERNDGNSGNSTVSKKENNSNNHNRHNTQPPTHLLAHVAVESLEQVFKQQADELPSQLQALVAVVIPVVHVRRVLQGEAQPAQHDTDVQQLGGGLGGCHSVLVYIRSKECV